MHPYHPEWRTFSRGDVWDTPNAWRPYMKEGSPTNPKAIGGHSDAFDWDRHLGHVSIVYDMLLPFVMTDGVLTDDDCGIGIRESGNGIPDLLDEARNEVDFWLNLRDGEGYSHGITCPSKNNEFYQAGITTIAAWANAVNSAMLGYCFQLINSKELEKQYLDSALVAFNYAMRQPDQMLDKTQNMGNIRVRGKDLKMTAAAFLYNLTGDKKYEGIFHETCDVKSDNAVIADDTKFQIWAIAGYLFTKRPVNYPEMYQHIANSVIAEAHKKEAGLMNATPSRRGTDNDFAWTRDITHYYTSHNMHRTMIAHAITKDEKEKDFFLKAMILEADWGLGRNPLNIIQMTTATTPLENKRSVVNIYTTGRNDGTFGMHPGHTPYLNAYDWRGGKVMATPSKMVEKCYPQETDLWNLQVWPMGEIYFDTRYVYAHSEFTPQQTMRGKMALYGYLYAIDK
jgi:DNA-binding cell septation regulator SpoVG